MFLLRWNESASKQMLRAISSADEKTRGQFLMTLADIEELLAKEPTTAGESRNPGTRVVVTPLLTVTFHPNVRFKEVYISAIRVPRYGSEKEDFE
jgi:hypothetical protein